MMYVTLFSSESYDFSFMILVFFITLSIKLTVSDFSVSRISANCPHMWKSIESFCQFLHKSVTNN